MYPLKRILFHATCATRKKRKHPPLAADTSYSATQLHPTNHKSHNQLVIQSAIEPPARQDVMATVYCGAGGGCSSRSFSSYLWLQGQPVKTYSCYIQFLQCTQLGEKAKSNRPLW